MVLTKTDLKKYFNTDLQANGFKSYRNYLFKLFYGNERAYSVHYLRSLRRYEYYLNTNSILKHLWRYINRKRSLKYGLVIGSNMVGPGLSISHLQGGVIINCFKMGANCSVAGGVVVGNKDSQDNRAYIGDCVHLTLGAKVIGKVTIGDNVVVAPNSVVVKDILPNSVVSGIPAKVIKVLD